MSFGNAALPTRKYVYGARETLPSVRGEDGKKVTFPGHATAIEQMFIAHRFQNKLVELERTRRDEASQIIHARFPDLTTLLTDAIAASSAVDTARVELSRQNSETRTKRANTPQSAEVRRLETARKVAWTAYRSRRTAAYADPVVVAELEACDERWAVLKGQARDDAVVNGLYWGTAAIVLPRVKRSGPPPKFKRWQHEGMIAVQFQRKPDKSSPQVPVLDSDGQPRIHPRSGKPTMRHEQGGSLRTENAFQRNNLCWLEPHDGNLRFATVHFRTGSDDTGAPLWAHLPIVMHRPFPTGAEIKWAYLCRRKIGTHYKWEVHFDVAMRETGWTAHDDTTAAKPHRIPAQTGTVAVSLGWRKINDTIRVAVWHGSDGATGEVVIPAKRIEMWKGCDSLRSITDKALEQDKAKLRDWLANQTLPDEWKERTQSLHAWKSSARLAALVIWWRTHRLPNDEAILRELEGEVIPGPRDANGRHTGPDRYTGGRKQNRHLVDWSENLRTKCRGWRKWYYREVAIELRTRYKNVVIADIDWHAIAENPEPEELDVEVNKTYRGIAACASLKDQLIDCMVERRVPAPGITVTCNVCGGRMTPPGRGRWVRCESCGGDRMDRAENAAKNLLRRGLAAIEAEEPSRV